MKIIFLDIDGPISWGTWDQGTTKIVGGISIPYPWVQEECDSLTKIIRETGAKIVISSDWKRYYTIPEFEEIFKFYGIPNVIIGTTSSDKAKMSSSSAMDRAYQITKWVIELKKDIESWIAIDDYGIGEWFEEMSKDYPFITKDNAIQTVGDHSETQITITEVTNKIIEQLNGKRTN